MKENIRTCACCGREFDLSEARMYIGRRFGAGTYNDQYPDGDVCEDCALADLGAAMATFNEMAEMNPHLLDDDD